MTNFLRWLTASLLFLAVSGQSSEQPAMIQITTSMGVIKLELDPDAAPLTTQNFLSYVDSGFYDGLVFHRVIPNFMIQGGGMSGNMRPKATQAPIQNEADNGLKNDRGSIAMARTNDPHSATAQFFINLVDNDFLNHTAKDGRGWGYAVFGKVVEGMEVVDAIAGVKTGNLGYHQNVPVEPVVIEKVEAI